jgi:uncharacterized membrane protein
MAFIGRLHPLLIHFPIVLVLAAAAIEIAATVAKSDRWRAMAAVNVRAAAVFAALAVIAGWRLAQISGADATPLLEWHRWVGTTSAALTIAAAIAGSAGRRSSAIAWLYRPALFAAGLLVAVAGHLGGLLVWGAEFLRP